jgi:hypothetical protein
LRAILFYDRVALAGSATRARGGGISREDGHRLEPPFTEACGALDWVAGVHGVVERVTLFFPAARIIAARRIAARRLASLRDATQRNV